MARLIAVACLFGAALCAVYDIFVRHAPLSSWHIDIFQVIGWVLVITGIIAAARIKPKGAK
jgi:uncharacterized RDD family membrane protein YckC